MKQITLYRLTLGLCVVVIFGLVIAYFGERRLSESKNITMRSNQKIMDLQAKLLEEDREEYDELRDELAAEKKAHAVTRKTLVDLTKSSYLTLPSERQRVRDREVRLKAYERAYPEPRSGKLVPRKSEADGAVIPEAIR